MIMAIEVLEIANFLAYTDQTHNAESLSSTVAEM